MQISPEFDNEHSTERTQTYQERKTLIHKIYLILTIQLVFQFLLSFIWTFTGLPSWLILNYVFFILFGMFELLTIIVKLFWKKLALSYPVNYIFLAFNTILSSLTSFCFTFTLSKILNLILIMLAIFVFIILLITCISFFLKFDLSSYGRYFAFSLTGPIVLEIILILMAIFYEYPSKDYYKILLFLSCCLIAFIFILLILCFVSLTQLVFARHKESFGLDEYMRAVYLLSLNLSFLFISIFFIIYFILLLKFL